MRAGIAGPTVAYWLKRFGFAPTLLERAPALRSGGYVIDFWGLGYDIAEKMGLLPPLFNAGYYVKELRIVDAQANAFPVSALRYLMSYRWSFRDDKAKRPLG